MYLKHVTALFNSPKTGRVGLFDIDPGAAWVIKIETCLSLAIQAFANYKATGQKTTSKELNLDNHGQSPWKRDQLPSNPLAG